MPNFERICPECGASNSFDKTLCVKCRAPLTPLASAPMLPPALLTRTTIAKLAWRATKFLARTGLHLALSGTKRGINRVQNRNKGDVSNEIIQGDFRVKPDQTAPSGKNRGVTGEWRAWSAPPTPEQEKAARVSWGKKK